jgi:5-formyltetrahydrofolate cyclo-ligase
MTNSPRSPDAVIAAKKSLRAHAVAVRAGANLRAGAAAAEALARHATALAPPSEAVVAGYWPMGDEIDPRPLMLALAALGCRLALPVVTVRGHKLDFRAWSPGDLLEPGPHGTLHPPMHSPLLEPDMLLVPLLAFDRCGFRLGYGGGYYDRTLDFGRARRHLLAIGVAFAAQEVVAVPRDGHDQPMDRIATETDVIVPG